ncbi:MAG: VOC family protein [Chloroflexales bacterium]|nr:VOC family protein [Chloroflexales bacterium]
MAKALYINHATLIVSNLEQARAFYEQELGLEPLPTFNLDFPAQFYRVNERQQLHISEWPDQPSFRGHICFQVDDFNGIFNRMSALGVIDVAPWGRVRRLPDGAMQMFVRDPSGNLLEISCHPSTQVDEAIFDSDLVEAAAGVYVSERNDARGARGAGATLYHGDDDR